MFFQAEKYGDADNTPYKYYNEIGASTVQRIKHDLNLSKCNGAKTQTQRRYEAINCPYNPIAFSSVVRYALGITELDKTSILPPYRIFNFDKSQVELGESNFNKNEVLLSKELKQQLNNARRSPSSTRCVSKSGRPCYLGYIPLVSAVGDLVAMFLDIYDESLGSNYESLVDLGGQLFVYVHGPGIKDDHVASILVHKILIPQMKAYVTQYETKFECGSETMLATPEAESTVFF